MTKLTEKTGIEGTRAGNSIRFTCPACARENVIITRTPKDHFKEVHISACKRCRVRSTVLTPSSINNRPTFTVTYPGAN